MTDEVNAMSGWNAQQYLLFEGERTRPARDLLAHVPLRQVRAAIDLGCGPGNSTELIANRYPEAKVTGLDSSEEMLRKARERLPLCAFIQADIASWTPQESFDLVFANAVLQWVPEHQMVMRRILGALPAGSVMAVQMPSSRKDFPAGLMAEIAKRERWAGNSCLAEAMRGELPGPESYYDLLKPGCRNIEIWQTVYLHVMDGPKAIVEWFKGSALRPFLSALDAAEGDEFLKTFTEEVTRHYQPRVDGRMLLRLPRLFVVATK